MNSLHPGIGQVDIGEAPAQRFVDVGFASESNVREALESMHPMGSPGEATDVAAGVGFPACDASRPPDLPPAIGLP